MALSKKDWFIIGGLATISVGVSFAYYQYKKLMNFEMKFHLVKFNALTTKQISFDIAIDFMNKSSVGIHIINSISSVYLNDNFVTTISTNKSFTVNPNSTSQIPLTISFNPGDVRKSIVGNFADIILNPEKINIRVATDLKSKFWGIPIPYKGEYVFNLKDLLAAKK